MRVCNNGFDSFLVFSRVGWFMGLRDEFVACSSALSDVGWVGVVSIILD